MKKLLALTLIVASSATFATACGKEMAELNKDCIEVQISNKTFDEASTTVKDGVGRDVVILDTVNSIIVDSPRIAGIIVDLGLAHKIVGVDKNTKTQFADVLNPLVEDLGNLGSPNEELAKQLNADLVLTVTDVTVEGAKKNIFDSIAQNGAVVGSFPNPATLGAMADDLLKIGRTVKKNTEVVRMVETMEKSLQNFTSTCLSIKLEEKKTIFYDMGLSNGSIYTTGSGTFTHDIIKLIGGANPFEELTGWNKVSEEQVLEKNPEGIFVTGSHGTLENGVNAVLSRTGWESVAAVKNKDVYAVVGNEINQANHRIINAIDTLAKSFYPNYYAKK